MKPFIKKWARTVATLVTLYILFIVEFIRYIIMWGFIFFHDAPEAVVRGAGLFWVVWLRIPQV